MVKTTTIDLKKRLEVKKDELKKLVDRYNQINEELKLLNNAILSVNGVVLELTELTKDEPDKTPANK